MTEISVSTCRATSKSGRWCELPALPEYHLGDRHMSGPVGGMRWLWPVTDRDRRRWGILPSREET